MISIIRNKAKPHKKLILFMNRNKPDIQGVFYAVRLASDEFV